MAPAFPPAKAAGASIGNASAFPLEHGRNASQSPENFPVPQRSSRRPGPRNPQPNVPRHPNTSPKSQRSPNSDKQALECAQHALEKALGDGTDRVAEMAISGQSVNQGITIDLSHNNLYSLPDDAIDIINYNIESNSIYIFPPVLLELNRLEILDLSRNKLKALPEDIVKMTSLKVLAAQRNEIEDLPFCVAEMASLLALKVDINPLNPILKRIVEAHPLDPATNGVRDNESTDLVITAQIKQFLKHEARPAVTRAASEKSLGSSEEVEAYHHSSKRSRAGRFPIKVNGTDEPVSRPPPFPAKSHSKALSLHNNALWSPGTIPLALDERERSQSTSDVPWTPDPRDVRNNTSRPAPVVNKRFGVHQVPQLPTTDRLSQHLRGLSLSAATSSGPQPREPKEGPSPSPEELLNIIPISKSIAHDPLLDMARTVFLSLHRIHCLVEALSSLTSDGGYKRSSLQMVVYNASLHLGELGRQLQNYTSRAGQDYDTRRNANQIKRACTVLIKAYLPLCSQICQNVGLLVERADERFVNELMCLLYTSVMGLRAELLRTSANHEVPRQTPRPSPAPEQPPRTKRSGKRSLFVRTPAYGQPREHSPSGSITPRWSPWTPLPLTPASTLNGEHELLDQLHSALFRLCNLIPETLPVISRRFLTKIDSIKGQRSAPRVVDTWRSALDACSKVINLTEAVNSSLASVKMKLSVLSRDLYYRFIDAWATFGSIVKTLNSRLSLEPDTRKRLQQIQQLVKEAMHCLTSLTPPTAPTTALFRSPAGSLPSIPLTPQQASLGPAAQATLSLSP
ncbi:Leucine-rich repeat-containing protein [Fusarium bulbicola]|nr:Leucine-rich repeat-containing protein [Fusarium bulbicola]